LVCSEKGSTLGSKEWVEGGEGVELSEPWSSKL
jgi:hypothetical protein